MPILLPDLAPESWKYSNINAALKKIEAAPVAPVWEMTGAFEFLCADAPEGTLHIVIPRGIKVTAPLELVLRGGDKAEIAPRVVIDIGDNAEAVLWERQSGEGAYWKNIHFTVNVGANAKFTHYRLGLDDPFSVVRSLAQVTLARDARYHFFNLVRECGFVRNEVVVHLEGFGGEAELAGLSLLRRQQHGDTTVCINHEAPHCRSSQFFKTVLDDQARGVFQGKIHVFKDAQKTDGYQLSNNLLLSSRAEMDVKPELEIYADDVKCSHGTTTGELDETPLFYLMSRGIPKEEARRLLLEAFLGDVLTKIEHEDIAQEFRAQVASWLI
ncbi:MAG: Fe-S cluster assembly protein SufD [Pseudobdellovibrionaceae bacterium]